MLRAAVILVVLATTACQSIWGVGPTTLLDADAASGVDVALVPDGGPDVASPGPDAASPGPDAIPAGDADCVPTSCAALDAGCGAPWDRCGTRLACGDCATGSTCVDQVCQACTLVATTHAIDIPTSTVSLHVTQDHLTIADRAMNGYGMLTLRNVYTNDTVAMGPTDAPESHTVAKGLYDVYFEYQASGSGLISVPTNALGLIASGVRVDHDGAIPIDMHTVTVDRVVTVNGAPVPSPTVNGQGNLALRSHMGDAVVIGTTDEATHPARVIAGLYDVYYENLETGTGASNAPVVPVNTGNVATVGLYTSALLHLDIHVATVRLDITFNGQELVDRLVNGQGQIMLRDASDNAFVWETTDNLQGSVPIIAGTYKIFYSLMVPGSGFGTTQLAPRNGTTQIAVLPLVESRQYDVDVPVVNVTRAITVNGQAVTDAVANGDALISLGNTDVHEVVSLGVTHDPSTPVPVIGGTYDVYLRNIQPGSGANGAPVIPYNSGARIRTQVNVLSTHDLAIDVPAVSVDRTLLLDGLPLGADPGSATLVLVDATGSVRFGTTGQASYPVVVIPGTYTLAYMRDQFATGSALPVNSNARLPTPIDLSHSGTVAIDLTTGQVNAAVTVAGAPVPDDDGSGFGYLSLVTSGHDVALLGTTYMSPVTAVVLSGTSDLVYTDHDIGTGPATRVKVPENLNFKLGCVTAP